MMSQILNQNRFVLLTVDYEIFGNGTGDVRRHVIDPTERMARLCQQHQVPLTVFFEVEEYVAFVRHAAALRKDLGYDPAALMRAQVADLVRSGHDVQLHLHPEWYGAHYESGSWRLRPEKATVDSLFASQGEVTRYIAERKGILEEMIRSVSPERRVRVYRAGAFSAQPGTKLLRALSGNGFVIDSSVVSGMHRKNAHVCLDYRQAPAQKPMWRVKSDVAVEEPGGSLWEIPIGSVPGRRFQQVTFGRLKAKFSRHVPRQQQDKLIKELGVKFSPSQVLRFLWQQVPIKLDFHNVAPGKLIHWINAVPTPSQGEPDVVVLIGHTKEHIDDRPFAELLQHLEVRPSLRVSSMDNIASLLSCAAPWRSPLVMQDVRPETVMTT